MAEFPALPLWTDAYLGDTTHLTTIEHGAYLLLLMAAWRTAETRLPDDDRLLARYARLGSAQWVRIKPVISAFFVIENGWWTQRRLTDEAVAVRQLRERQSSKGRASALKRKGRHSTAVQSGCDPVATERQPDANLPISTPTTVAEATGAPAPDVDPVKALFDLGVGLLGAAEGASPKAARACIGRWRKERGDSWTLQALTDARARGISAPTAWIEGRLRGSAAGPDAQRAASRATAERYRRMDAEEGSRNVH
jgi:uncharacterized protein YdaU (DUF1376 family)